MVTFTVGELVERCEKAIKDITEAQDKDNAEQVALNKDKRAAWIEKYMPEYVVLADIIVERYQAGEPITEDDFPKVLRTKYGNKPPTWDEPEEYELIREPRTAELLVLRDILNAMEETKITTAGLKEVGFNNIRLLFNKEND